jgi:hypothetical protein
VRTESLDSRRAEAYVLYPSVVRESSRPVPNGFFRRGSPTNATVVQFESSRSLRRAYLDWVEEQLEEFKETVPRSDLLRLADEVVNELRMTDGGQYQLTELLLCTAVDRKIFRMLGLPGYRSWCRARRQALSAEDRDPLAFLANVSERHEDDLSMTHLGKVPVLSGVRK